MMTPRERILAVYNGEKPDRVPYMLDLSHYYLHKFQLRGFLLPSADPFLECGVCKRCEELRCHQCGEWCAGNYLAF